jgi:hypothetical protein
MLSFQIGFEEQGLLLMEPYCPAKFKSTFATLAFEHVRSRRSSYWCNLALFFHLDGLLAEALTKGKSLLSILVLMIAATGYECPLKESTILLYSVFMQLGGVYCFVSSWYSNLR